MPRAGAKPSAGSFPERNCGQSVFRLKAVQGLQYRRRLRRGCLGSWGTTREKKKKNPAEQEERTLRNLLTPPWRSCLKRSPQVPCGSGRRQVLSPRRPSHRSARHFLGKCRAEPGAKGSGPGGARVRRLIRDLGRQVRFLSCETGGPGPSRVSASATQRKHRRRSQWFKNQTELGLCPSA